MGGGPPKEAPWTWRRRQRGRMAPPRGAGGEARVSARSAPLWTWLKFVVVSVNILLQQRGGFSATGGGPANSNCSHLPLGARQKRKREGGGGSSARGRRSRPPPRLEIEDREENVVRKQNKTEKKRTCEKVKQETRGSAADLERSADSVGGGSGANKYGKASGTKNTHQIDLIPRIHRYPKVLL
jgi:hypothetical protein